MEEKKKNIIDFDRAVELSHKLSHLYLEKMKNDYINGLENTENLEYLIPMISWVREEEGERREKFNMRKERKINTFFSSLLSHTQSSMLDFLLTDSALSTEEREKIILSTIEGDYTYERDNNFWIFLLTDEKIEKIRDHNLKIKILEKQKMLERQTSKYYWQSLYSQYSQVNSLYKENIDRKEEKIRRGGVIDLNTFELQEFYIYFIKNIFIKHLDLKIKDIFNIDHITYSISSNLINKELISFKNLEIRINKLDRANKQVIDQIKQINKTNKF